MTSDGYTAQPEDLQNAAPRYDEVSQQIRWIYDTLTQELDSEDACWGDDDAGRAFGQRYCPSALTAIQQLSATQIGVQSMVDGICSWARNYVDADQEAQAGAAQIDPGNG